MEIISKKSDYEFTIKYETSLEYAEKGMKYIKNGFREKVDKTNPLIASYTKKHTPSKLIKSNVETVGNEIIVTENIVFISKDFAKKQALRRCYKILSKLKNESLKQKYVTIKITYDSRNLLRDKIKKLYGTYEFKISDLKDISRRNITEYII